MATKLEKLNELVGANDLTNAELRRIFATIDDDEVTQTLARRLERSVIATLKTMERIPPAIQVSAIQYSEKAAAAIGELLHPDAQDLIVEEYTDDVRVILTNAAKLKAISDSTWAYLTKHFKTLTPRNVKALLARPDCSADFADAEYQQARRASKLAGFEQSADRAEKQRRKATVQTGNAVQRPRSGEKSVKRQSDDDFANKRKVSNAVKTVKRSTK